jgi:hypothetical protein
MFNNKDYYRKLEAMLEAIEHEKRPHHTLARMVDRIVSEFCDGMRITSGRLYVREGDDYYLRHSTVPLGEGLKGFSIPADYPPLIEIGSRRVVMIDTDFPGYDQEIEGKLGISHYAAFMLASGRYLVTFGLEDGIEEESLLFALGTIQHSLSLQIRQSFLAAEISEAEQIQLSLLPT